MRESSGRPCSRTMVGCALARFANKAIAGGNLDVSARRRRPVRDGVSGHWQLAADASLAATRPAPQAWAGAPSGANGGLWLEELVDGAHHAVVEVLQHGLAEAAEFVGWGPCLETGLDIQAEQPTPDWDPGGRHRRARGVHRRTARNRRDRQGASERSPTGVSNASRACARTEARCCGDSRSPATATAITWFGRIERSPSPQAHPRHQKGRQFRDSRNVSRMSPQPGTSTPAS